MALGQLIQITPPSGDGADQIPEGGETKIDQIPDFPTRRAFARNVEVLLVFFK
jgi:hypothetical protein